MKVDDDDEGDLLKQALAMSMTDGDEIENMRVRLPVSRRTGRGVEGGGRVYLR